MSTVSEQTIMYKIIDGAGNEVEKGFISFGEALARCRKLKQLGRKDVFVADAKTRVIYKKSAKKRKIPRLFHSTR